MTIPDHLITPGEWHAEAVYHAAENLGTPEGRRALAEAARYAAMFDMIKRLTAERDALRDANASLHAQVNDWHRRAVETREERDALAARERACPTLLEAEARALMRGLQEVASAVGLGLDASPADVVAAVKALASQLAEIKRLEPVVYIKEDRPITATQDGCGACGDACASRGACRLAEESPPASPCRCGPDGCSDSVSCPRNGGAA